MELADVDWSVLLVKELPGEVKLIHVDELEEQTDEGREEPNRVAEDVLAEGETTASGEFVPVLHNDELHDVLEGNADIESAILIDTLEHIDLLISDLSTEKLIGDAYLDDDIENDCIHDALLGRGVGVRFKEVIVVGVDESKERLSWVKYGQYDEELEQSLNDDVFDYEVLDQAFLLLHRLGEGEESVVSGLRA